MKKKINYKVGCPICGAQITYTPDDVYSIGRYHDDSDIEVVDCKGCHNQVVLAGLKPERSVSIMVGRYGA